MLPDWPRGTVSILATAGEDPHAIPVSTALRAGPRTVLLALAQRRESLARLRADPRVALTVLAAGDVALTAHGRAAVLDEIAEGIVAVRVDVERVQEHGQPTFVIDDGVRWHWTDAEAEKRSDAVLTALVDTLAPR
jgi:flavin reductase (DIM6/NTAB) family NADH-FMN oxidoreductase RutF